MAADAAVAAAAARAAFIAAMKSQYGGDDADYEDIADNMVVPIITAAVQHIIDNP